MLNEQKQKELDKNLDDLQQVLYSALKRFAENSDNLIKLTNNEIDLLAKAAVYEVEKLLRSR